MSERLESLLDDERRALCAANDEAMSIPLRLRVFGLQIKEGTSVRAAWEAMAHSSMEAVMQHMDLCAEGQYIVAREVMA